MSKLSRRVIDKIKEDVLYALYQSGLRAMYTQEIGNSIARDNELVLRLLKELKRIKLVKQVGEYKKRRRWIMTDDAYHKYSELS